MYLSAQPFQCNKFLSLLTQFLPSNLLKQCGELLSDHAAQNANLESADIDKSPIISQYDASRFANQTPTKPPAVEHDLYQAADTIIAGVITSINAVESSPKTPMNNNGLSLTSDHAFGDHNKNETDSGVDSPVYTDTLSLANIVPTDNHHNANSTVEPTETKLHALADHKSHISISPTTDAEPTPPNHTPHLNHHTLLSPVTKDTLSLSNIAHTHHHPNNNSALQMVTPTLRAPPIVCSAPPRFDTSPKSPPLLTTIPHRVSDVRNKDHSPPDQNLGFGKHANSPNAFAAKGPQLSTHVSASRNQVRYGDFSKYIYSKHH